MASLASLRANSDTCPRTFDLFRSRHERSFQFFPGMRAAPYGGKAEKKGGFRRWNGVEGTGITMDRLNHMKFFTSLEEKVGLHLQISC